MADDQHINPDLDNPLKTGERVEIDIILIKKVLSREVTELMHLEKLSKTKMAARMEISRRALDRLLDPTKITITLNTLDRAARVIDKKLQLRLVSV